MIEEKILTDGYYKAALLAENIYHIYEPGGVYTTLVVGEEKALLIDAGYGYGDLAGFLTSLTQLPIQVVLTHGHTDHVGGCFQFEEVYMSYEDWPTYHWYEDTQKGLILEKFRRDRTAAGKPMPWPDDFDKEAYLSAEKPEIQNLEDGQIFDLGGRKLEIISLPGHTSGSVMLYDDLSGLLFSGDNISDSLWIFFKQSARLSSYASRLREISKRSFAGIVYSHRSIIFPKEIIADILATIEQIDPDTDKEFTHPRTGQKAQKHREACSCMTDIRWIYVVYDRNLL